MMKSIVFQIMELYVYEIHKVTLSNRLKYLKEIVFVFKQWFVVALCSMCAFMEKSVIKIVNQ